MEIVGFAFFVDIEYENVPEFCSFCSRIGHPLTTCKRKEQSQSNDKEAVMKPAKATYVQVGKKIAFGEGTNKDLELDTHDNSVEEPMLGPKDANKDDLINDNHRGNI